MPSTLVASIATRSAALLRSCNARPSAGTRSRRRSSSGPPPAVRWLFRRTCEGWVELKVFDCPQAAAVALARRVVDAVHNRPNLVLGLATGRTPVATYGE